MTDTTAPVDTTKTPTAEAAVVAVESVQKVEDQVKAKEYGPADVVVSPAVTAPVTACEIDDKDDKRPQGRAVLLSRDNGIGRTDFALVEKNLGFKKMDAEFYVNEDGTKTPLNFIVSSLPVIPEWGDVDGMYDDGLWAGEALLRDALGLNIGAVTQHGEEHSAYLITLCDENGVAKPVPDAVYEILEHMYKCIRNGLSNQGRWHLDWEDCAGRMPKLEEMRKELVDFFHPGEAEKVATEDEKEKEASSCPSTEKKHKRRRSSGFLNIYARRAKKAKK